MSFEEKICEWVATDNKIRKYNEALKQERAKRTYLAENIISYAEVHNLHHSVIQITDGKLKFQNVRNTAPLTLRFLTECLTECLGNEESVKQIMNYIKTKREVHYRQEVKRYYK